MITSLMIKIIKVAITLIIASILSLIVRKYFSRYIHKYVIKNNEQQSAIYRLIEKIFVGLILIGALYFSLNTFFPQTAQYLSGALIAAGFLSIVIGLAAQKTLENFFAGFSILLSKPVKIGDAVVISNEYGTVEDITLRHTIIKTWDNRRMVIPNSVLNQDIIINYTMTDKKKLYNITVGVTYDTDIDKVEKIMVNEAIKNKNVSNELRPIFQVLDFANNAITLRLLFISKDQPTAFNAGVDIRKAIKKQFDKKGIKFSTSSIYVIDKTRNKQ